MEVNNRKEANAAIEALIAGEERRLLQATVGAPVDAISGYVRESEAEDPEEESEVSRDTDAPVLLDREKGANQENVGIGNHNAGKGNSYSNSPQSGSLRRRVTANLKSADKSHDESPGKLVAQKIDQISARRSLASAADEKRKRRRKRNLDNGEESELKTFLVSLVAPVFTAAEDFLLDIAGSPYRSAGLTQPFSHLFDDEDEDDSGVKKVTENSEEDASDDSKKNDSDNSSKDANNSSSPHGSTSFFEDLFQTGASAEKAVNHNVFSFRFWGRIYVALWKIFAPLVDPYWDNEAHQMFKINRRKITYMEDAVEAESSVSSEGNASGSKDSEENDGDSSDTNKSAEQTSNVGKSSDDKSANVGKPGAKQTSSESLLFAFERFMWEYPGKFFAKIMVRLSSSIAGLIQWFSFIFFLFFTGVASLDDAFSGHVASNLYRNTLFYSLYRFVISAFYVYIVLAFAVMIRENLAMVGVRMGGKLLGAVTAGVVASRERRPGRRVSLLRSWLGVTGGFFQGNNETPWCCLDSICGRLRSICGEEKHLGKRHGGKHGAKGCRNYLQRMQDSISSFCFRCIASEKMLELEYGTRHTMKHKEPHGLLTRIFFFILLVAKVILKVITWFLAQACRCFFGWLGFTIAVIQCIVVIVFTVFEIGRKIVLKLRHKTLDLLEDLERPCVLRNELEEINRANRHDAREKGYVDSSDSDSVASEAELDEYMNMSYGRPGRSTSSTRMRKSLCRACSKACGGCVKDLPKNSVLWFTKTCALIPKVLRYTVWLFDAFFQFIGSGIRLPFRVVFWIGTQSKEFFSNYLADGQGVLTGVVIAVAYYFLFLFTLQLCCSFFGLVDEPSFHPWIIWTAGLWWVADNEATLHYKLTENIQKVIHILVEKVLSHAMKQGMSTQKRAVQHQQNVLAAKAKAGGDVSGITGQHDSELSGAAGGGILSSGVSQFLDLESGGSPGALAIRLRAKKEKQSQDGATAGGDENADPADADETKIDDDRKLQPEETLFAKGFIDRLRMHVYGSVQAGGRVGPAANRSGGWGDIVSVDKSAAGVESTGDSRTKVFYNYDFPVPKTSGRPASSIIVMKGDPTASSGSKGDNNSGGSSSSSTSANHNVQAATAVGDRNVVLTHWLNPNSKDHLNGLTRSLHADLFQNSSLNSDLYLRGGRHDLSDEQEQDEEFERFLMEEDYRIEKMRQEAAFSRNRSMTMRGS